MIPLTNYDFQWGRSEVVIIYPDYYSFLVGGFNPSEKYESQLGWLFRFPIYGKTKNVPNHQSDYILEFLFLTIMFYPNPHDCLWFLSKCLPNVPIVDVFFPESPLYPGCSPSIVDWITNSSWLNLRFAWPTFSMCSAEQFFGQPGIRHPRNCRDQQFPHAYFTYFTHRQTIMRKKVWSFIWLLVKTLAPSEPQNSW